MTNPNPGADCSSIWSAVLDLAAEPMLVLDSNGVCCYCNSAAQALFGQAEARLLGKRHDELVVEGRAKVAGGALVDVRVTARMATTLGGDYQVLSLRQILRQEPDLPVALASLSHELRTPLSAVLGWAQLGASGRIPSGQYAETFAHIADSAWMIKRHFDDIFQLFSARKGTLSFELEPLELGGLVGSALESLRGSFPQRADELEYRDLARSAIVMLDRVRFAQVVENLVGNAFKHSAPGASVRVVLELAGEAARLSVHDSGEGIEAGDLELIFEPFARVPGSHRRRDGLGLGLAISADLVRCMGGRIWAESAGAGKGASFFVEFPVWAPALIAG